MPAGESVQLSSEPSLGSDKVTRNSNTVISQGRAEHGVAAWNTAGYNGSGVKVGIIDSGFAGIRALQNSGELPRNVTAHCYNLRVPATDPPTASSAIAVCDQGSKHGSGVAEAIIDLAPGVEIYIANPRNYDELRDAVLWMTDQGKYRGAPLVGVDIINHSVGYGIKAPGDGTSMDASHPLNSVKSAVDAGVVWVNAAGNDAETTWYGPFREGPGGIHYFSGTISRNVVRLKSGDKMSAYLRWQDRWPGATCNLSMYLYDVTARSYPRSSNLPQSGGAHDIPYEEIRDFVAPYDGDYWLSIYKGNCSTSPTWMQMLVTGAASVSQSTSHHSVGVPEESKSPGMLAVGAAPYYDINSIEDYSNRGPTAKDGRIKPELVGVDCARSVTYSLHTRVVNGNNRSCWFSGTSQSAPHVTALAALVINRYGTSWGIYKPADVANYLKGTTTKQSGLTYPNNTWGHGFAHLPNPAPTAHLSRPLLSIQEQASTSIAIRTNLTRPDGVRVEVNNDKLAVHASCTAADNDRADFFAGESVTLKGCSPGRVELRLYKRGTDVLLRIYDVTVTPKTAASLTTGTTATTPSSFTINQNTTFSLTTTLPATTRVDIKINNSGDAGRLAFVASGVGGATGSSSVCPGAANSQETHSKGDSIILRGCTEGNATIKLYQSGTTTELASYSVAVGSATTLAALPPPTGLSISSVDGSPRRLLVSYTRPPLTHRYRFELYKLELATDTWFLESAKGTGKSSINLGAGPGSWHRARGRSCLETNSNICGVWSDWSPRYEFSNPTIAITGLTGSYIAGDTDTFNIALSDLTLDQPYTVTFRSSHRSIGFNFQCSYFPTGSFTPLLLSRAGTLSFTLHACGAPGGTITAQLRKGNARGAIVATATATVTVTAATASLSPRPSAITVGHDQTFTLTTNVPSSAGVWVTATVSGDIGRTTLPPTESCLYASSGHAAVNGNTITLRGCRAGRTKLTIYRSNSIIQLASYDVTVNASDTELSPRPSTITAGQDLTFTLSTGVPNNPGVWITATVPGNAGRTTLPPTRGCLYASSGIAAVNGNTITLRGCQEGATTLTIYRSNSSVLLASYTVNVAASNTSLSPTPAAFTIGANQTFTLTTDIANTPGVWVGLNYNSADTGRLVLPNQDCSVSSAGTAAVNGNSITLKPCTAGSVTIMVNRSYSSVTLVSYPVTVNSS